MDLPEGFLFSQSSLQIFCTCRRWFELQYINQITWPAVQSEPALENERVEQLGIAFHRLAQQHLLGLPDERLSASASANRYSDGELENWWQAFMNYGDKIPTSPGEVASIERLPEVSFVMQASFGSYGSFPYRLYAKFDALALIDRDGQRTASILDWKTTRRKPRREHLAGRLQTRIYPYLLTQAGSHYNHGQPFTPEAVEMIYWYASDPNQPERFPYSKSQADKDAHFLSSLIQQVEACCESGFEPCTNEESCVFCRYRSLCGRGIQAGAIENKKDLDEIDLQDIDEIEIEM
jgi:hypothetical protein